MGAPAAAIGTVRVRPSGTWVKTDRGDGPLDWEYQRTRLLALTVLRDEGWAVGTVIRAARWPQPRTIARIDGGRVWLRWRNAVGKRQWSKPVRSFPGDVEVCPDDNMAARLRGETR